LRPAPPNGADEVGRDNYKHLTPSGVKTAAELRGITS
jgi:hypothetical protein